MPVQATYTAVKLATGETLQGSVAFEWGVSVTITGTNGAPKRTDTIPWHAIVALIQHGEGR